MLTYATFKNESDFDLQDHTKNVILKIKIVPISGYGLQLTIIFTEPKLG